MKKNILKVAFLSIIFFLIFNIKVYAANIVIVLDPGHGGIDSGAVNSSKGIMERDINLKIAKYLKEYLSEYAGVDVYMTHTGFTDGTLSLEDRALFARKMNADLLLCLHCNSSDSGNLYGAEAYVTHNTCLPKYNQECTKIGNLILKNLEKLGITNRGVKIKLSTDENDETYSDGTIGDYYGIIRHAMTKTLSGEGKVNIQNGEGISTVLLEHCFINGTDYKFLDSESDIQKLAKADCDAVVEYYNLRLKKECVSSVKLNKNKLEIVKGDKENLSATVLPNTAVNKNVKWSSSNENVVKVDKNGNITAVGVGNATIIVKTEDGGFTDKCNITVTGLQLEEKEIYILKDDTYILNYEPKDLEVEFVVEDEEVIKITDKNVITALNEGECKITLKSKSNESILDELTVNVAEIPDGQNFKINNLKEANLKLSKISEKTSIEDLKKNIELSSGLDVIVENNNKDFITTNTSVSIINKENNKIIKKYKCIVYGDLNEDGKITAADYVMIKNHIMEDSQLNKFDLDVADVSRDGNVTTKDYVLIKNHIMNGLELAIE